MNKAQLIDQVAEKAGMSRAAAARAVDAIFDTAGGAVSSAVHTLGEVSIKGFGKFTKKTLAARQGRNPRTGAVIEIPERSTISFRAGKNFRHASEEPANARTVKSSAKTGTVSRSAARSAAKAISSDR